MGQYRPCDVLFRREVAEMAERAAMRLVRYGTVNSTDASASLTRITRTRLGASRRGLRRPRRALACLMRC